MNTSPPSSRVSLHARETSVMYSSSSGMSCAKSIVLNTLSEFAGPQPDPVLPIFLAKCSELLSLFMWSLLIIAHLGSTHILSFTLYFFIQEKEKSYIIFDKKQKIKSVPTTKYLKTALEDYSEALEYSEDLKNFMYSDTRLSWSDFKSQYPNSKAIVNGEDYISVNNGFTLDEVYNPIESCGITCRDKDWNITKISDSYLYAKIDTKSFNTMFNDCIKLNNGKLIILSTYLDSKNSGMFLYLLNSNLNLENELCIPGNNSTSYIGYNLCPTDDEGF